VNTFILPSLQVDGVLELRGKRYELRNVTGYHDHNWGVWGWGRGLRWNWGYSVAVTILGYPAGPPFTVARPGANTTINAPPNPSMVKVRVVFAPTAVGHFTAVLTWADGTGSHSLKCFVQGNGIAAGE